MQRKSDQAGARDSALVSLVRLFKIGCVIFTVLGAIFWVDYVKDPKIGQLWKGGPNTPLSATVLWVYPALAAALAWLVESNLRSKKL